MYVGEESRRGQTVISFDELIFLGKGTRGIASGSVSRPGLFHGVSCLFSNISSEVCEVITEI